MVKCMFLRHSMVLLACSMLAGNAALAAEATAQLVIRAQHFAPEQLELPQGQKVKLTIRNEGDLPAEFESYDLSREVIVPPHGSVVVYVGPLQPGRYGFFNDFNPAMKGNVVVSPAAAAAD